MTTMEERVSRLEGAYEQVDRRLGDLTVAVEGLRVEVDALRSELSARLDSKFNALIAVMATMGVAVASGIVFLALRIP